MSWLNALKRTYAYEPACFTTSSSPESIANGLVFCVVSSWLTGQRLVSLPFSDHCDILTSNPEDAKELSLALIEHLKTTDAKYAEVRPIVPVPTAESQFQGTHEFFVHSLSLVPSVNDLFKSFHRDSIQRKIRRAEREGLRVERGRSDELLRSFYHLLLITRKRHGVPPPPRNWFRNLIGCFGDCLAIRVAYHGTIAIAAVMTIKYKDALVYKYAGSDARFHSLGGMHILIWRAIQEAKLEGLRRLDFGRSDIDNHGLITFKDRWGTTREKIAYLRCTVRPVQVGRTSVRSQRTARRVFNSMPETVLSAAGRLLYRHVG